MRHEKIILGVICLVCIFVFCFMAITGKIYTIEELPLNFMSAFLGSIVTALITLILLRGQTSAEEIKERNVIVFNKKSVIFEEFIKRLYKVLQKQKINGNDYIKIKTEFYTKLMLYLKKEAQQTIINKLESLAEFIGVDMDGGSFMDKFEPSKFMVKLNEKNNNMRENIFIIIDVLIGDLGLGGKMNIAAQNNLEKNIFPFLSSQILLEEVDNLFIKKDSDFFDRAGFVNYGNGLYIVIDIKGKISSGGRIEIGPFSIDNNGESYQERLKFRLLAPQFNPLAKSYVSCNNEKEREYIIFYCERIEDHYNEAFEYVEYDQIDLTCFSYRNLEMLKKHGIKKEDIFKEDIYKFGFSSKTYTQYGGFYLSICKAIAARAYFYFLTSKTEKDGISIKELCEKFGEVTDEEIENCLAKQSGLDLSD